MSVNPQNEPQKNSENPEKRPGKLPLPTYKRSPMNWLLIIFGIMFVLLFLQSRMGESEIRWDEFVAAVKAGNVESITIHETEIRGKFTEVYVLENEEEIAEGFKVYYYPQVHGEKLDELTAEYDIKRETAPPKAWLYGLLNFLFPLILFIVFFYFLFGKGLRGGAGGMLMSFGRSRHRLIGKEKVKVTFEDVAGIEEAKDEVSEIIAFLKDPKRFQRLGGRIPRGVLLVGPPGCGKTLLAKAIAGEADVPFLSISGSDFVEMFVGVGASRVRDLFSQAKENAPCIIFLDEIDAIGRRRGAGAMSGGHDEREQTLNAILVEMDGFNTDDQVIVIAATNRSDILDNALTRPGRFDRQVVVPLPDLNGREKILEVHAKKIKIDESVDLKKLARGTPMFSGADLAAIINEAALMATMADKEAVEQVDLEEARDKVRWGRAKRGRKVDEHERKITAFHEAGHTLVQSLLDEADPLHKVSIIPRGPMGGATFALPEKDRTMFTRRYCMALLQVCLGGRIAEELFCDDISSGAQQDIQQATNIARRMILVWGMSEELGPVSYESENSYEDSLYGFGQKEYSEKTAESIDNEVRKLVDTAYHMARDVIEKNRDNLENIANALLKYETLDAADVQLILDGGTIDKPTVADLLEAEKAKTEEQSEKSDEQESDSAPIE